MAKSPKKKQAEALRETERVMKRLLDTPPQPKKARQKGRKRATVRS